MTDAATPPPYVSVVIPTCNRREILSRCLAALARQTYRCFEVIVVDDYSSDGTDQMLEDMTRQHGELVLRVLRNESHAGANPSRNRGVAAAEGDLVAFLDSDCVPEPSWLENMISAFKDERVAAVSGRVVEPPPQNIYELTFKGTNRLHRAGAAHRLVAGNLCVRRSILRRYRLDEDRADPAKDSQGKPDTAVSGRGDEEGLYLMLRAAGHVMLIVPEAVVLHVHPLTRRSFYRQAFRGGKAAARLVYKYCQPPRLDLLPFLLAYLSLPLGLIHAGALGISGFFFAGGLAALAYNDLFRKGKTIAETLRSFPTLLLYYHVRLAAYVLESLRLRLTRHDLRRVRLERLERASTSESVD